MPPESIVPLPLRWLRRVRPYLEGLLAVAAATVVGRIVQDHVEVPNISLVFVVPVLVAALRHGLAASLWSVALSILSFDYFFLQPLYLFTIADPADVVALVVLLVAALVASGVAARMHAQAQVIRHESRINAQLYDLSRQIAGVLDLDDFLWIVVSHLARVVDGEIIVLMPVGSGGQQKYVAARSAFPPDAELSIDESAAAQRCWERGEPGESAQPWRIFLPIRTGRSNVGVLAVLPKNTAGGLAAGDRELLEAVSSQIAVAAERLALAHDIDQARLGAERERLRSSMLTSVSHDLRTPLASITGALSSLSSHGERYDEAARHELLGTALGEAERLDRFVGNLLDMTRLDAGAVSPRREPVDVGDLVSTTLRRATPVLKDRVVATSIEPGLPLLSLDFVLAEQALFNLLDNAAKYSPDGGRIEVAAHRAGGKVEIVVRDEGPGIPADALSHLFEKFYRADAGDRRRAGTGLGLAIARGFVEALGGTIEARNRGDRFGAEFVVSYPVT